MAGSLLNDFRERLQLPPYARDVAGLGPLMGTHVSDPAPEAAVRPYLPVPPTAGRLSWDMPWQLLGGMRVLLPPDSSMNDWRALTLDADDLTRIPAARLLEILADLSPDVSRALWDFLRLCNPGWEVKAFKPGTKTVNVAAQKVVDEFFMRLRARYGSVDVVLGRMYFAAFIRGAMLAELVLDRDARTAIDLATPDPITIRFERAWDPILNQVWIPGQYQGGNFVEMTRPTIRYMPIDPAPGVPYGRSPAAPAIFASLFMLGLLHDVRRVVAQQGHMRLDISVDLEELRKSLPPNIVADPQAFREWIDVSVQQLQKTYRGLGPDDAYFHTSDIKTNRPMGTLNSDAVAAVDGLIKPLERLLSRSLKTTGLLMGLDQATSDATATRQWEVEVAGIKSVQHLGESMMGEMLTTACNAAGEMADVQFSQAELRVSELFRDEQTRGLVIDNVTKLYLLGHISQNEAADITVGHKPDKPEPRETPKSEVPYMSSGPQAGQPQNGPQAGGAPDNQEVGDKGKDNGKDDGKKENDDTKRGWLKLTWPRFHGQAWGSTPPVSNGHSNGHTNGHERSPVKGTGAELAYVPEQIEYDEGEQRMLSREWDRSMRDYEGLLDARVEAPAREPVEA